MSSGTIASSTFITTVLAGVQLNGGNARVVEFTSGKLSLGTCTDNAVTFEKIEHAKGFFTSAYTVLANLLRSLDWNPEDSVLMSYPRSLDHVALAYSVTQQLGWKFGIFSTELIDEQRMKESSIPDYLTFATQADIVWAVVESLADFWQEHGVSEKRIFTNITTIFDDAVINPDSVVPTSDVVFVGNIEDRYWEILRDIAGIMSKRRPDFTMQIYAASSAERKATCQEDLRARGLEEVVKINPVLCYPDLVPAIACSRVAISPCPVPDGFPQKIGDYLCSGRPIVSPMGMNMRHTFSEGKNILTAPMDDLEGFTDKINQLLDNPAYAREVGLAGQALLGEYFSGKAATMRFMEQVQSITRRRKKNRFVPRFIDCFKQTECARILVRMRNRVWRRDGQ